MTPTQSVNNVIENKVFHGVSKLHNFEQDLKVLKNKYYITIPGELKPKFF